jgi:hypothetical protein
MTDIVKRLRTNHPVGTKPDPLLFEAADEIESLRQHIQKLENYIFNDVRDLKIDLAECQAQVKQAKREALLDAAEYAQQQSVDAKVAFGDYARGCENEAASIAIALRNMAKELE